MIIGLGHQRRVGKDTIADILVRDYGFTKMSFTHDGGLQEACMTLNPIVDMEVVWSDEYDGYWKRTPIRYADVCNEFGYEGAKDKYPEVVRTLQRMGTEVGRNIIHPDVWVNIAIAKCYEGGGHFVFTNCRYANEATAIHRRKGVTVHVERPGIDLNDPEDIATHSSELGTDIEWDFTVVNDGTLVDLRARIGGLMWALGVKPVTT